MPEKDSEPEHGDHNDHEHERAEREGVDHPHWKEAHGPGGSGKERSRKPGGGKSKKDK